MWIEEWTAALDRFEGGWGKPFRLLEEVDSTNSEALRWAAEDPPHGALVVGRNQQAGRGRHGRTWVSEPDGSLTFSMVLRTLPRSERLGLVPLAAGLACAVALEETAGLAIELKWPNDLLCGGRKLGGILVERVERPPGSVTIVGVGINLDLPQGLPAEIIDRTTSIAGEGGRVRGPHLLTAILQGLETWIGLLDGSGDEILEAVRSRMPMLGHQVRVTRPGGSELLGAAVGIAADGALELSTAAGPERVLAGEVERVRHEPAAGR